MGRGAPRWKRSAATGLVRLGAELGIEIEPPDRWLDSRAALARALELNGDDETAFRDAVWRHAFEQREPLGERGCEAVTTRLGWSVDPQPAETSRRRLERLTRQAGLAGVAGVPTFLLDGLPVAFGIQAPERLLAMLERYRERALERAKSAGDAESLV